MPVNDVLDDLLACLDLDEVDTDLYRGQNERDRHGQIFGGQVVGQALVAATRTVEGRAVHSLHAYFLRRGDPTLPILFQVRHVREGRPSHAPERAVRPLASATKLWAEGFSA